MTPLVEEDVGIFSANIVEACVEYVIGWVLDERAARGIIKTVPFCVYWILTKRFLRKS
jgi:hypothetical protein